MTTMGAYLRTIGGGPVEICMRQTEPGYRTVVTEHGAGLATGQDLVAFTATNFREASPDSDLWEFDVVEKGKDDRLRHIRQCVCGADIVVVRTERTVT